MNKFVLLSFVLVGQMFAGSKMLAQQLPECEKVVNLTVDAINGSSADKLKKHLSPDFTCAQQTGPVALWVLEQLVTRLDEHVSGITKVSEQRADGLLTLVYDFNYSKRLGHKNATFVFDAGNRLKQLDLLEVQIKKADVKTDFERSEQDEITISLEIHDSLLVATAELDGIRRKFIIDTGAPTLYLNSKYQARGDSTRLSIGTAKSVASSSISGQNIVHVDSFDFYGIKTRDKEFLMSDLSHLLADEEIYGLIGFRVIKDYDWLFDYEQKSLTLIRPEKTAAYLAQMGCHTVEVPLEMVSEVSHIPFVKGMANGREVLLGIDSGANTNLLDISLWEELKDGLADVSTSDLNGAAQEKVSVAQGKLKSLVIGGKPFTELSTVFHSMDHLNARWKHKIDGLIGYEVLSRQKTLISIPGKRMVFIE